MDRWTHAGGWAVRTLSVFTCVGGHRHKVDRTSFGSGDTGQGAGLIQSVGGREGGRGEALQQQGWPVVS
jgi:hypothetical protein